MKKPLATLESEAEAGRLSRRNAIRAGLARAQMLRDQADAIDAEVRRIKAVIQAAADDHFAACSPLQAELGSLEAQAVERIRNRQEPDPAADARRREILAQIQQHNTELKEIRDRQAKLAEPLEAEAAALRIEAAGIPTEVELTRKNVGSPALLIEYTVVNKRAEMLAVQLQHATGSAARTAGDSHVNTTGCLNHTEWTAVADALAADLSRLRAESARLYQALIDE